MSFAGKGAKLCKINLYGISMDNSLGETVILQMWNWKSFALIKGLICIEEIIV